MAVRHGYGKVAGASSLVFAYDTGDTINSYKGEPTTNLLPNGVAAAHDTASGNIVTVTDATNEKGPGWKKVTITARGTNFRTLQWTYITMAANIMYCHSAVFDWGNMRNKGYFINHDGNGTGQRFFYKPGNYTTNQGATITINSTLADGKIAGNIIHTASHSHAFFINNSTTGVSGINDYFYYKDFQVEVNSHPTPYTTGTRSATQGLLDLTGRSTVDIANVSFDANAQPFFDGVDDQIYLSNFLFDSAPEGSRKITHEYVIKFDSSYTGGWQMFNQGPAAYYTAKVVGGATDGRLIIMLSVVTANYWHVSNNVVSDNVYNHIVFTMEEDNNSKWYINGVLDSTITQTPYRFRSDVLTTLRFGKGYDNTAWFKGDIPVAKVYNRALTADEIRNNYRNYKTRFNI